MWEAQNYINGEFVNSNSDSFFDNTDPVLKGHWVNSLILPMLKWMKHTMRHETLQLNGEQ